MKKTALFSALSTLGLCFTPTLYATVNLTDADFPLSAINTDLVNDHIIATLTASGLEVNANPGDVAILTKSEKVINIVSDSVLTVKTQGATDVIKAADMGQITVNGDIYIDGGNTSTGGTQRGIFSTNESNITLNNNVQIVSNANQFVGVMSYIDGTINFSGSANDELDIYLSGNDSWGIVSQLFQPAAQSIDVQQKTTITMTGSDSHGVAIVKNNAGLTGQSNIHFHNGLNITTSNGVGILSDLSNGIITIDGTSNLTSLNSSSYNTVEILAGTVNLNGTSTISGDILVTTADSEMHANAQLFLNGNTDVISGAIADFNLTGGSIVNGAFNDYYFSNDAPKGQIALALNDSVWNMKSHSELTSLTLNKSQVNLRSSTPGTFQHLLTNSLSGDGVFTVNVDLVGHEGDLIEIHNAAGTATVSGNHLLSIINDGSSATDGTETQIMVKSDNAGTAIFNSNVVGLGGYSYQLRQTGQNWTLTPTGALTSVAQTSATFLNTTYLLNYVDTQTLMQRMGDIRNIDNSQGDIWIRGFTGRLNAFSSGKLSGFSMDYSGVQIGADKLVVNSDTGRLYLGAMMGYTDASPKYSEGSGSINDNHLGLYATYLHDSGFYIDGLARFMHAKNSFTVQNGAESVDGSTRSNGVGASLELGKRMTVGNGGFYVEPQAQLTYQHQAGSNTYASNGLTVKLDSYDSTLGRVSAILGYDAENAATPVNVYVKLGYVKEFSGDVSYRLNESKESQRFNGSWFDSGLGLSANVAKNHNFYGEVSYAAGNTFDKKQINLGYRFNF